MQHCGAPRAARQQPGGGTHFASHLACSHSQRPGKEQTLPGSLLGQPGAVWGCATHGAVMPGLLSPLTALPRRWQHGQKQHPSMQPLPPGHSTSQLSSTAQTPPATAPPQRSPPISPPHSGSSMLAAPTMITSVLTPPLCQPPLFNAKLLPALFSHLCNL